MKQLTTTAIILSRTDYGEADRILTLLTPDYGKLRLLAKGVRRVKSKMAGGIELFSVSEITFIKGRGEVGTLVSTRLVRHYERIVGDLDRTMLGYELIKKLNKITEDEPEAAYFTLLQEAFEALHDTAIPLPIIQFWFTAQLLRLGGHSPNLQSDTSGAKLVAGQQYSFSFERMAPVLATQPARETGGAAEMLTADHIKLLRLVFGGQSPRVLAHIANIQRLLPACQHIVRQLNQITF